MKKLYLSLACTLVVALLAAGCSPANALPPPGSTLSPEEAFDPGTLVVSIHDLRQAMLDETEDLIVVGVINPNQALIPFSMSSRAIEGAYLVWRPDYSSGDSSAAISPTVTGMRRSVPEMEELLSRTGATPDSKIVVYAADAMHDAARFVWQLRMLGHENAWYLDGGINAWHAADYPTGRGVRMARQPIRSEYSARDYVPERFNIDLYELIEALENPEEWVVIDTRSRAEYEGERTGSSSGAFGTGRIANSVFITWSAAIDPDTQLLRSREEIEEIYAEVLDGRNIAVFCQSGVRSAHTWLVLTEVLGLDNVYNYEGSWIELSYAASQASDYDGAQVLSHLELWSDNNRAI